MTIGERIKERRIALGMTQDELAQKIGYKSRSSVNKLESARVLPSRKIEKMASALECTPSYLMGWTDSPMGIPVLDPPEQRLIPQLVQKYSPEEVDKAMRLYEKYKQSIPQVKEIVESLLKPNQSDS